MPQAPRHIALLFIILTSAFTLPPAGAADQAAGRLQLAQEAPPQPQTGEEAKKPKKKKGEKEDRRPQKSDAGPEKKQGTQEGRQGRKREAEQNRIFQQRGQNGKKQQGEAEQQKRKEEIERVRQEREQQKARQQEEQKQRREAEQQKRKEEMERVRQEREQQKARQQEELKQQRESEQKRKEEMERVRQEREQQKARQQEELKQQRDAGRGPRSQEKLEGGGASPTVAVPPASSLRERRFRREEVRKNYSRNPRQERSFEELKRNRRERTVAGGKLRVIEEPDRRTIVKQDDRVFIRHDESERFRRISPDARTIRRADGTSTTFMTRRGGVRIYDVTDRHGRLLYRYRRYPNGREVVLIDNRRYYRRDGNRTRDVLIGAGIGLLVGSAIALAAPDVRIPREEYIVDYGLASEDDLYEALTAPPVDDLERGYSLEEVRYSRNLRDRMRRIDLDTVTFDFGSWEVGPDQARALDRLANGILRMLERNPDEIVMIEGHTDAVGSEEDNLTLSDRRAQSVAEILTTEFGVPPENLVTQGYGEEQLKIPTSGPERANRRIAVRRIGPLLTGRFEDERYSGPPPADDRGYD